jgi:glyoxalase family protein
MHFVVTGRLEVRVHDRHDERRLVARLSAGDCVGELSLLTGETRAADVLVTRDAVLARLGRDDYEALVARHPEISPEVALQGFDGVRAFAADPEQSRSLLEEVMGFRVVGEGDWELRGPERGGLYGYDTPPASGLGAPGAGTVHHVAWSSTLEDHDAWQRRVSEAGMHATPVIDRFWFRSVYFREPSGVLFELATLGPGFGIDEEPDHLGESLILPPAFEHLRPRIEQVLTPLPDPRAAWA